MLMRAEMHVVEIFEISYPSKSATADPALEEGGQVGCNLASLVGRTFRQENARG